MTDSDNVIAFDPGRRRAPRQIRSHAATASTRAGIALDEAMESWEITLNAKNRSSRTIDDYRDTVSRFAAWLESNHYANDIEAITGEQVALYLTGVRQSTSPGNAHKHFRNLKALFNWAIRKQERTVFTNPVDIDCEPNVPKRILPNVTVAEMVALLDVCSGTAFNDRRDKAIIATLYDTGLRLSGVAGLRYSKVREDNDVRIGQHELHVLLKGGDSHIAPFGVACAEILDSYRRSRSRHPFADEPWFWLGRNGRFSEHGIPLMLERRGRDAEVEGKLGPHRFRRAAAIRYLRNGGDRSSLARNLGWKTTKMADLYTEEDAKALAREEHRQVSPLDALAKKGK